MATVCFEHIFVFISTKFLNRAAEKNARVIIFFFEPGPYSYLLEHSRYQKEKTIDFYHYAISILRI